MSALDAAVKVLAEARQAMTCREMIDAMAAKGYWTSPAGQTPGAFISNGMRYESLAPAELAASGWGAWLDFIRDPLKRLSKVRCSAVKVARTGIFTNGNCEISLSNSLSYEI